jgi:diguanylate cyclase (GGDEF)-like protein/PAS domain S-box-containing protein
MKPLSISKHKANILVVDDKPENLRLLAQTLTKEGYEIRGVINGVMALRAASTIRPDLILLDINMPEMNGYEVCRHLKTDAHTKDIPVIFLSANNNSIDKVTAFEVGGVDYINKPFQIEEVLARIKNQLELQAVQLEVRKLNLQLEDRIKERTAQLERTNQELKQEIAERRKIAQLLRESEEKLESILNSLEEVVWSADVQNHRLMFLNSAAQSVYGRTVEELIDNPQLRFEVIHPEDRHRVELSLLEDNLNIEYRIIQPNGSIRWVWERSRQIYGENSAITRLDGIICDITDRKKIEAKLSYEATHDALTGLPNRLAFTKRVDLALELLKEQSDYLFAVLFIDLDRFKVVNDSLGHLLGDKLLMSVADSLHQCLRSGDFVARLGGDEFTILLDRIGSIQDAINIARRIQQKLDTPFDLDNHHVFTSASIGIVLGNREYQDSSEILRDADIAMYRAKFDGKARHRVFDQAMYAQTIELLEIENDLRNAISNKEFMLHYQPIVDLETTKLYGFEALVRWQHPQRGLLYPDKFIHVAEETGSIVAIGDWVLEAACSQLRSWQLQFPQAKDLSISVNIASQQLKEPNFLQKLEAILSKTQLSAHYLHLELTETTLMEDRESTIALLDRLRAKKVQLSIDDFGTGYSSLQYLNRFAIDILKIDRSFVGGMLAEKENLEIVRAITTLAQTLNINIIAEGIEDRQHLEILKTLNCKLGQGYHFSKPLDSVAVLSLFDRFK